MPSKFKISASEKTVKVRFNWLSADLVILLCLFAVCLLAFIFFAYAIINSEKVPISFFLGAFLGLLFVGYLGYATFRTLFNRTFFSLDNEQLIVKRKPFIGLEYPETISLSNFDTFLQKSYLFFFYKVVAKLKDGGEVPVFNYHYYDSNLFKDLQQQVDKLIGRQPEGVITGSETAESNKNQVSDLNIYKREATTKTKKSGRKKLFSLKKKTVPKSPDYPGTQEQPKSIDTEKKTTSTAKAKTPKKTKHTPAKPSAKSAIKPTPVRKQKTKKKTTNRSVPRRSAEKEQLVPIRNAEIVMDQIVYIGETLYYAKRIFHYNFNDNSQDKVFQIVTKNNKRRFFYLRFDKETIIHEERELSYNDTKEIAFNTSTPGDHLNFEGADYNLIHTKQGISKSVETGREVNISQWLYRSENDKNQQIRVVEGDNLLKIHFGNPVPTNYITTNK